MSRHSLLCLLLLIACSASMGSAAGQTPVATPAAARSYENTCDGAQAWFDDLHEATDGDDDPGTPIAEMAVSFLDYFRNSNPPPILAAWIDAEVTFWANISDFDPEMDYMSLLDAIEDAEEDLADLCEDHDFTENFWG